MKRWKSFHIFYQNFQKIDNLIEIITQECQVYQQDNLIDKWFYIRYWVDGPHIRLRLLCESTFFPQQLIEKVSHYIENNRTSKAISKEDYYSRMSKFKEVEDIKALLWHEEGKIVPYQYKPEYERYGGAEVMEISETMFMFSSKLANWIQKNTNKFELRLFFSICLSRQLVKSICIFNNYNDLKNTLDSNITFWEELMDEDNLKIREYLKKNELILSEIEGILKKEDLVNHYLLKMIENFEKVKEIVKDKEYINSIAMSHIHMFNNRMGIVPVYECEILRWIKENLG